MDMADAKRPPATKMELYEFAGITPELEAFVNAFIQSPEILSSLSPEKQQQIEAQMDAVIALMVSG